MSQDVTLLNEKVMFDFMQKVLFPKNVYIPHKFIVQYKYSWQRIT